MKRWLYGMRKAASGWEDDYARRLVEDGFRRGRAASTILYHPKTQVRVVVHGDDFTFAGTESELKRIQAKNVRMVRCQVARHSWQRQAGRARDRNFGQKPDVDRKKVWSVRAVTHRQALLEGLGLNEDSKAVNSAQKRFRSLAATLNYMSSDRSDVQYAAKEVCTRMANPTRGS